MNHVLEHVESFNLCLKKAFKILKPGGTLLGQLPTTSCFERTFFNKFWAGFHFPRHLQIPSRLGLNTALLKAGFQTARVLGVPHVQSALSLQNVLVANKIFKVHQFGKIKIYNLLILLVLPLELIAYCFGKGGIVNFVAKK